MSLRARLLLVTVGLVTLGLLIADVVTYRALSSSLLERVDEQLAQVGQAVQGVLGPQGFPPPDGPGPTLGYGGPPAGSYAALVDVSGHVVREHSFEYQGGQQEDAPVPDLPDGLPGSTTGGTGTTIFFAGSQDGDTHFRVEAVGPQPNAGTLVGSSASKHTVWPSTVEVSIVVGANAVSAPSSSAVPAMRKTADPTGNPRVLDRLFFLSHRTGAIEQGRTMDHNGTRMRNFFGFG